MRTAAMTDVYRRLVNNEETAARQQGTFAELVVLCYADIRKSAYLQRHFPLVHQRAKKHRSVLLVALISDHLILEERGIRQLHKIGMRQSCHLSPP